MGTYIIAEIGNTHEGSLGLAKQFIKAADGVDCVKFQTHIYEAESLDDAQTLHILKMSPVKNILRGQLLVLKNTKA